MLSTEVWPPGARRDVDLTRSYYVIVGNGISGLTNHLTLLASALGRERLGGREILHIGGCDPWQGYVSTAMGQWPAMVVLPEFVEQYRGRGGAEFDFLGVKEFGLAAEGQWLALAGARSFWSLAGEVKGVRAVGTGYELAVETATGFVTVRADFVDVCGGPGPARRLAPGVVDPSDAVLLGEYVNLRGSLQAWPRVVTGDWFLGRANPVALTGQRVLVVGGGATAAWCVERAEQAGHEVWWLAEGSLRGAFLPSGRNDGLAQGPLTRQRMNGVLTVESVLFPSRADTRFGEGYLVKGVRSSPGGLVEVSFAGSGRLVDGRRRVFAGLAQEEFAQVVVALGQLQLPTEVGSWAHLLQGVLRPAVGAGRQLLKDRFGRCVGLQSLDGKLRVLGAAGLGHPDVVREWRKIGSRSHVFFESLAGQGKVNVGVALCGLTVAEANRYWDGGRPNENLNTAMGAELPGLFGEMGPVWTEMRASRVVPFTEGELGAVDKATTERY